jgi:hypothetical protein
MPRVKAFVAPIKAPKISPVSVTTVPVYHPHNADATYRIPAMPNVPSLRGAGEISEREPAPNAGIPTSPPFGRAVVRTSIV